MLKFLPRFFQKAGWAKPKVLKTYYYKTEWVIMQILLTVAYDGTNYAGWQRQVNAVAVQEKVEDALSGLLKLQGNCSAISVGGNRNAQGAFCSRTVVVRAASRTDAGVHALGQRAAFFVDDLRVPLGKLPVVLNGLLPSDISVTDACVVGEGFNPRFDALRKTYVYNMYNAACPNPLLSRYSAFVPQELDFAAMEAAAGCFVGRHDFAGFCAVGSSAKTTVREVFSCGVARQENGMISLEICGGGFLYNMVRIIAGTVLYVGLGKILPENIPEIIASCKRENGGKTMPPQGLTLVRVEY